MLMPLSTSYALGVALEDFKARTPEEVDCHAEDLLEILGSVGDGTYFMVHELYN